MSWDNASGELTWFPLKHIIIHGDTGTVPCSCLLIRVGTIADASTDSKIGASAGGWGAPVAAPPDSSWNTGGAGSSGDWGAKASAGGNWGASGESGDTGVGDSNVSKHANGDFGGGAAGAAGDDGCRK